MDNKLMDIEIVKCREIRCGRDGQSLLAKRVKIGDIAAHIPFVMWRLVEIITANKEFIIVTLVIYLYIRCAHVLLDSFLFCLG